MTAFFMTSHDSPKFIKTDEVDGKTKRGLFKSGTPCMGKLSFIIQEENTLTFGIKTGTKKQKELKKGDGSMLDKLTFFEMLKQGLCNPEAIDDFIDEWHVKYKGIKKLHEFLGMTKKEYSIYTHEHHQGLQRFYNIVKSPAKVASKKQDN